MSIFRRLRISHKVLIALTSMLVIGAGFRWMAVQQVKLSIVENRKEELITATAFTATIIRSVYQSSIQNYLRGVSETQLNTVDYFYSLYQQGSITESEAKNAAQDIFSHQTIGTTGYNTAVDISRGRNASTLGIHPSAKDKDISQLDFVQHMFDQRTGYMEFEQGSDDIAPASKSQYMGYFEPWQWIINAASNKSDLYKLVDIDSLSHYLEGAQANKTASSYITVFDSDGYAIYHPVLGGQNILNIQDTSTGEFFLKNLIQSATNVDNPKHKAWVEFSYTPRGEASGPSSEKLIYYQYLPEFDWFVATIINKDDTLISYNILFKSLAVLAFLGLLVMTFLGLQLYNYITKRLEKLMMAAHRFAKNEYDFSIQREHADELGDLEEVFGEAAAKITNLVKKQSEANSDLETTVSERTQELEDKNKELEALYVTDRLTGLFNRHKIDETFVVESQRSKRYHHPLGLIMLDIDNFKQINDRYGHLVGDEVLMAIADILRSSTREADIVGRWGGEEFVVVCPSTNLEGLAVIAENLRKKIAEADMPSVGNITASFGISDLCNGCDVEQLIHEADEAMFAAKAKGKNCVVVFQRPSG